MSRSREKQDRNRTYGSKRAKYSKWNDWAFHTTGSELVDKYTFLLNVVFLCNKHFISKPMSVFVYAELPISFQNMRNKCMWISNIILQNENPNLKPIYWLSNQYRKFAQVYYQRIQVKLQHEESLTSDVLSLYLKRKKKLAAC